MLIAALLFPALFLLMYVLFCIIEPDVAYLPSTLNIITLFFSLWISIIIKNGYARAICFFWSLWFMIGSISLYAQNQLSSGLNYNVNPDDANQYYLNCVAAASFLILVLDRTLGRSAPRLPARLGQNSNPVTWLLLLTFPIFYAASIYASTGDIPIFSGRNVSALMYEVDYGPLHGFGIFVTIAIIAVWAKTVEGDGNSKRSALRPAAFALVALLLVIAAMDGRRALAIFALFGIILFSSAQPGRPTQRIKVVLVAVAALISYVAAATIRTGNDASQAFATIWDPLSTIGTEYRDYVYGFVRFSRADVLGAGFDWLGSTVATLIPSGLLTAVGANKEALRQADSARVLMDFWNVKLGIRIGLPGELWFAYGVWGIPIFACFGAIVYAISNLAIRTNHTIYRAILLSVLGIWATSVQGQSTVTFGLLLPLVYFSFLVVIIESVFTTRAQRMGRRHSIEPNQTDA